MPKGKLKRKCLRCEAEFLPMNHDQVRCYECGLFIANQTIEAKTGWVTTRGGGSIPTWIAFRCLYCGEYFNQSEAEIHFGETRIEANKMADLHNRSRPSEQYY